MPQSTPDRSTAFAALQRFAQLRPQVERCELCSAVLDPVHPHLLEPKTRQITCACDACSILFCDRQDGRYLRVPRRIKELYDFAISDVEWEVMMLPIELAFFFRNSNGHIRAMYPSPAGAIESQLGLDALSTRMDLHPLLRTLEPEVEALLVNRAGGESACFLVPIDECYRLVGLIRLRWRGLSGGSEVWGAITGYFRELRQKAGGSSVRHA